MPELDYTEWEEDSGEANNAVATASRAADASRRHYITGVFARYDDFAATGDLTITLGSGRTIVLGVSGQLSVTFTSPLRGDDESVVSAALAAGGTGVNGRVVLVGLTRR